jgi:adenosylmethionine-8-amino-7-oxononanoate aminotransferase
VTTKEHLSKAMSAIQDLEETDQGRAQLNVSRQVYNLLADADITLTDTGVYETVFDLVSQAWRLVHGEHNHPELESIVSPVFDHVNYVNTYGAAHDR